MHNKHRHNDKAETKRKQGKEPKEIEGRAKHMRSKKLILKNLKGDQKKIKNGLKHANRHIKISERNRFGNTITQKKAKLTTSEFNYRRR